MKDTKVVALASISTMILTPRAGIVALATSLALADVFPWIVMRPIAPTGS